MNLVDPRRIGYNDLLDRVRALEGPTREIGFHERAIASEVEWQVKNYNHLLWGLVPWFLEEIQKSLGPEAWEIRRSRAVAVGRIGLHHLERLREVLEKLARHTSDKVATAVGYVFSEMCSRARDAEQEVCDILRAWVASGSLVYCGQQHPVSGESMGPWYEAPEIRQRPDRVYLQSSKS